MYVVEINTMKLFPVKIYAVKKRIHCRCKRHLTKRSMRNGRIFARNWSAIEGFPEIFAFMSF